MPAGPSPDSALEASEVYLLLEVREVGRVGACSRALASVASSSWQALLQRHAALPADAASPRRTQQVCRDLLKFLASRAHLHGKVAWTFASWTSLEACISPWRGRRAFDVVDAALFKELYAKCHRRDNRQYYKGHAEALQRCKAIAAVPLTLTWSSRPEADVPRGSCECSIDLPHGHLQLIVNQWFAEQQEGLAFECFHLVADVRGCWPRLRLLHLALLSLEPFARSVSTVLGRRRSEVMELRWCHPGYDDLRDEAEAVAGAVPESQLQAIRAVLLVRAEEAAEDAPGSAQSSAEDQSDSSSSSARSESASA
ncbi:mdlA [Symbiodinium sp. CCMP2456]|nr:mdlA [Symbiodinium sp. CCMP2456]